MSEGDEDRGSKREDRMTINHHQTTTTHLASAFSSSSTSTAVLERSTMVSFEHCLTSGDTGSSVTTHLLAISILDVLVALARAELLSDAFHCV